MGIVENRTIPHYSHYSHCYTQKRCFACSNGNSGEKYYSREITPKTATLPTIPITFEGGDGNNGNSGE